MNSSTFSSSTPSDFFSINNGVYFSGHDGDITVGSGNGYKTYLAWGTTGQSAHVINASGAIGLSTNLGTTPALSGTTGYGTSGQVLTSGGSAAAPTWTTVTSGITITDDTTTNATRYLTFTSATSGTITGENTSSTKLQFNPSTGALTSTNLTPTNALTATYGGTGLTSPGSSGNVLTSNGTAWVSSAPGGGSAMTLISTQTASSSASLSWTGLSGYDYYFIILENFIPVAAGDNIGLVVGIGSTTYLTGNYNYAAARTTYAGSTSGPGGTSFAYCPFDSGYGTSSAVNATGHLKGILSGKFSFDNANHMYQDSSTYPSSFVAGSLIGNSSAITAFKLVYASGNISSGKASLYGISS